MNKLQNIIIVAGGENTRFREMSIFPKILLPTLNYSSILSYNCQLFKNYNIYLIINDKYETMTKQYIDKTKLNVQLIVSHNHNGSANTINELKNKLPQENVLFIWSDLILDQTGVNNIQNILSQTKINKPNIIFTYNGEYRFKVQENKIIEVDNKSGNVPGIYYCENLNNVFTENKYPDNFDVIEIFKHFLSDKYLAKEYIGNIIEFRDLEIYLKYYKIDKDYKTPTRFFNIMEIKDDKLIKTCINENYYKLIDREIDWYNDCLKYGVDDIPKIYSLDKSKHQICIEYLSGYMNIYEFIKNSNDEEFNKFMKTYLNTVEKLHNKFYTEISFEDAEGDYILEYVKKVIDRCNSISGILYEYNEKELTNLVYKAFDKIIELKKNHITTYVFGHGDLNGSNVMYNPKEDKIKFIDPRGYFGYTIGLIPPDYDYAKIMYCLSGYDDFNNGKYVFTKNWYDIPKPLKEYNFGVNHQLYKIIVGIIWIALAEYISQDVFKANIAYRHGIKLLNQVLNEKTNSN